MWSPWPSKFAHLVCRVTTTVLWPRIAARQAHIVGLTNVELTRIRHPLEAVPKNMKKSAEKRVWDAMSANGVVAKLQIDAATQPSAPSVSDGANTKSTATNRLKKATCIHLLK